MTILTIQEAAAFLRLTVRTLYLRKKDIPHLRYGHRVMFIREDLEAWVRSHGERPGEAHKQQRAKSSDVDGSSRTVYHRNPMFVVTPAKEHL